MNKKFIIFLIFIMLSNQAYALSENAKKLIGLGLAITGIVLIKDGFSQREVLGTTTITTYNREVYREWDFQYRYTMYNDTQDTMIIDNSYTDSSPETIVYQWNVIDTLYIGSDLFVNTIYKNHHIEYIYVPNVTSFTTRRTEFNNIDKGIAGIGLLVGGVSLLMMESDKEIDQDNNWAGLRMNLSKNQLNLSLNACF